MSEQHTIEELADLSSSAPQLLGAVWNWFLYGILVVQFYVYSRCFPQDNKYIKLLGTRIPHLISTGADLYYWFAAGFGEPQFVTPFASFFDLQINDLFMLPAALCFGALAAFTSGILTRIANEFIVGQLLETLGIVKPSSKQNTWLVANTLSDLLIASAMIYYLRRVWAKDGYLSNHVLVMIVRLTVETNLVTTSVSIVSLVMIAVYPDNIYYLCPTYIIGKLYSNSLLASLNNRISIRDTYEARGGLSIAKW
ncbi:hypothetical protein BJV77DRAFT_965940 [Russula vinacea]|nr:hypothetical protein BJV77DRAFT_965940 [Russula vinacea]